MNPEAKEVKLSNSEEEVEEEGDAKDRGVTQAKMLSNG